MPGLSSAICSNKRDKIVSFKGPLAESWKMQQKNCTFQCRLVQADKDANFPGLSRAISYNKGDKIVSFEGGWKESHEMQQCL